MDTSSGDGRNTKSKYISHGLDEDTTSTYVLSPTQLDCEKLPNQCCFCGKMFAFESQVRRHMRVHTGEKPYACQFCNKTFAQRIEVLKHTRTHTGEKPFKCYVCEYRSAQLCNVKTHMKAKHPEWNKLQKQT